jgi:PqqD family protein of HPr-rel-A system
VAPRARADLTVVDIDGEAVAYDPVARDLHHLNHSAALVFELCDGRTTIAEMTGAISEAYEMDPRDLEKQIRPLLRQLRQVGLLEGKAAEQIAQQSAERDAALKKLRRIPVAKDT